MIDLLVPLLLASIAVNVALAIWLMVERRAARIWREAWLVGQGDLAEMWRVYHEMAPTAGTSGPLSVELTATGIDCEEVRE